MYVFSEFIYPFQDHDSSFVTCLDSSDGFPCYTSPLSQTLTTDSHPRIAGVIYAQVASKCIYVRLFRGTDRMSKNTWSSFGIWALIVLALWITAWIIAEAIPVFNDLLSLISALFASWFTYGISGVFWLFLNWGQYGKSWRKMVLTGVNVGCFFLGGSFVSFIKHLRLCFPPPPLPLPQSPLSPSYTPR